MTLKYKIYINKTLLFTLIKFTLIQNLQIIRKSYQNLIHLLILYYSSYFFGLVCTQVNVGNCSLMFKIPIICLLYYYYV